MDIGRPKVIKSARKVESEKKVADGILRSAYLTSFQREAMDGVVKSAMPEKMGPKVKMMGKVKPGKTHQDIGVVHYPGTKYGKGKRE